MKKVFVMIALVIGMIGFAQPGEGKRAKGNPEENVETMVKKMTETLGLNEKQQVEVKNLFTEQQKKHEAKRAEMKARKEKGTKPSDEEIVAIVMRQMIMMQTKLWNNNRRKPLQNKNLRLSKRKHHRLVFVRSVFHHGKQQMRQRRLFLFRKRLMIPNHNNHHLPLQTRLPKIVKEHEKKGGGIV